MKNYIDLRSDTCTLPSDKMRAVIFSANVGDYGYYEDPATIELEEYCAEYFGKEVALFMPTNTMSDQVALRCMTRPGDEVITEQSYHINYFQAAPSSDLARVSINTCKTKDGIMRINDIETLLNDKMRGDFFGNVSLLSLENTINSYAGKIFPIDILKDVYTFCHKKNIYVYVDGARFLNACVATGIEVKEYTRYADVISQSFSKGLGAPFGSILLGDKELMKIASKYRKWYGGHMHQSGFMAAPALYAIKNNINQLKIDHRNITKMAELIANEYPDIIKFGTDTNMLMLDIQKIGIKAGQFVETCKNNSLLLYPYGPFTVRATASLNVNEEDVKKAAEIICTLYHDFERNIYA